MHGIPRIDLNVEDILPLECIDVKCLILSYCRSYVIVSWMNINSSCLSSYQPKG